MRTTIKHVTPDGQLACPDNTTEYVNACINLWRGASRADGRVIHVQAAMEIAAWWHSPGAHGRAFAAFSHTGTVTNELMDSIEREAGTYIGVLALAHFGGISSVQGITTTEAADSLNALYALKAYVKAIPHADYPHSPGTLYGCPACEREFYYAG
jgi:hypothetical protein